MEGICSTIQTYQAWLHWWPGGFLMHFLCAGGRTSRGISLSREKIQQQKICAGWYAHPWCGLHELHDAYSNTKVRNNLFNKTPLSNYNPYSFFSKLYACSGHRQPPVQWSSQLVEVFWPCSVSSLPDSSCTPPRNILALQYYQTQTTTARSSTNTDD